MTPGIGILYEGGRQKFVRRPTAQQSNNRRLGTVDGGERDKEDKKGTNNDT